MGEPVVFTLNGRPAEVRSPDGTPLLMVLRNELGLTGTRYGCGHEQCGACMVLIDGEASYSCTRPVETVAGMEVETVESLTAGDRPHPLVAAFLAEQAVQCGYCASGVLISAAALLNSNPTPSEADIRTALDRNLCRCGVQNRMVRAVGKAAAMMGAGEAE